MTFGGQIGFLALVISLYILWQIRQLLLLFFTAVLLANALNIVVTKFQKLGIKRGYAVLLSVILLLAFFVGFFWLIVPVFVEQFKQLAQLIPRGVEEVIDWLNNLKRQLSPGIVESLPDVNQIVKQLQPFFNQLLGGGLNLFYTSFGAIFSILLLLILTLMLLADPAPYRLGFIRLFPSFYRRRVEEILVLCNEALQGWLIGIFFNMFVIGFFSFIGLLVLGIPSAFAQGLLAGILTFIPNIGPTLSVLSPMAIAFLEDPWKSLFVLILYFAIQQLETNFLTPFVMAQQVSLLPVITLLAQIFFASFFGFWGLLLALPLTVVGQVWLQEVVIKDILDKWEKPEKKAKSNAEILVVSTQNIEE